jgi:NAD+ diphosphatase
MTADRPNVYAGADLDRAGHRRLDGAWLSARLRDPSTRLVPVWGGRVLVTEGESPRVVTADIGALEALGLSGEAAVLLGTREGGQNGAREAVAYFAVDLADLGDGVQPTIEGARFEDLRAVGPLLPAPEASLLAYARGILHWRRQHRYCGSCGAPTRLESAGHLLRCSGEACGIAHHPRTDPAVIMLVHDGAGRCVLARNLRHPPGMHSVLAGFVEPGESLEEAVAREVREEVGLDVSDVRYRSSQPWPFPGSLMLGFRARAAPGEIRVDESELRMARWFTREELLRSPGDETFRLPRPDSIARRLVEEWLAEG